jgi:hypothetical protein
MAEMEYRDAAFVADNLRLAVSGLRAARAGDGESVHRIMSQFDCERTAIESLLSLACILSAGLGPHADAKLENLGLMAATNPEWFT